MKTYSIDINCDLGEGIGNEEELLPYISSCSIACGGHAGDAGTMRKVIRLAKKHKVKIGAHPSFPDKANFGRKQMHLPHGELVKIMVDQIDGLMQIANEEDTELHHVKPHGALYNMAANTPEVALSVIAAMSHFPRNIKLFAPYGSVVAGLAKDRELKVVYEAFADRNYNSDLSLVSRQKQNALITNFEELFDHVHRMVTQKKVRTSDGVEVAIKAETFCIHGDNPNAIELIRKLRTKLTENNINII